MNEMATKITSLTGSVERFLKGNHELILKELTKPSRNSSKVRQRANRLALSTTL